MAKKKTNVDLVLALPGAVTEAVMQTMTPAQKTELSARQAAAIVQIATKSAAEVAEVLDPHNDDAGAPHHAGNA